MLHPRILLRKMSRGTLSHAVLTERPAFLTPLALFDPRFSDSVILYADNKINSFDKYSENQTL